MCGILGSKGSIFPQIRNEYSQIIQSLHHRGPDASHFLYFPEDTLFLGHTRLKIIDLSDMANQPFQYQNRLFLTYNGEIYNYLEIKEELVSKGYIFQTSSDTEVLLLAYDYWGEEVLHKLNGMWAFAIWNSHDKTLFLSRDRFGVKPLYYYYHNNNFAFASEIKGLLSFPQIEFQPNHRYLYNSFFSPQFLECQEETIAQNISRLLPGESLLLGEKTFRKKKWWNPENFITPSQKIEKEEFFTLFKDACTLRMRADVPCGVALSGGLDSTSVASTLLEQGYRDRLLAFIGSYPNTDQDETELALSFAMTKQLQHSLIRFDSTNIANAYEKAIYSTEEAYDIPIGPYLLYEAYKKAGIKISIDGHGGDELLAGYSQQYIEAFCLFTPFSNQTEKRAVEECLDSFGISKQFLYTERKKALKRFLISFLKYNRPSSKLPLIHLLEEKYSQPHIYKKQSKTQGVLNSVLFLDFFYRTLPAILMRFDKAAMAHGVEIRSPFLDYRVVCMLLNMQYQGKCAQGYTKSILRESMKELLPANICFNKKKVGFASPMGAWVMDSLKPLILDTVRSTAFLQCPFFDALSIAKKIDSGYSLDEPKIVTSYLKFIQMHILLCKFDASSKVKGNLLETV